MKICVPVVDNESAKNEIAREFYNTNYFCIYDSIDKTYEWQPVNSITDKIGNLSIALKRKNIYAVIIIEMPKIAIELFVEMGIAVYSAQGRNLNANLELFEKNQLNSRTVADPDHFIAVSSCSGSCGSCSSSC